MAAVAARDAADGGEQGAARHAAFKGGVHLVVGRAGAERQGGGQQHTGRLGYAEDGH